VIFKDFGTESLPGSPVHLSPTLSDGVFAALLEIVIESLSIRASGVQVKLMIAVFPGAATKVLGDTVNTEGLDGVEILPMSPPPLPEFLMISLTSDEALIPIPTGLNVTDDGALIFAPFGVGVAVGVAVIVPVGVAVAVAVGVAVLVEVEVGVAVALIVGVAEVVTVGLGLAVAVCVAVAVGVGVAVRVMVAVAVGVALAVTVGLRVAVAVCVAVAVDV
jgi:hypothetical protein